MDLITNQTRENHQFRPSESELGTFGFHSDELGGFEETEGLRERWEEKGGGGWVGGGGVNFVGVWPTGLEMGTSGLRTEQLQ